jgi:hypothetical protein
MPTELTDADRAEITSALLAYRNTYTGSRDEHVYRAGIAAGIELAAQVFLSKGTDIDYKSAAAIRALLKEKT